MVDVHARNKQYLSLMYVMYANASNNTPFYTHISSYMVWRVQPLEIQLSYIRSF